MATVYILIGLPGCGKSTWREAHLRANSTIETVIISSDDIVEDIAREKGISYDEAHKLVDWKSATSRMRAHFRQALNKGQDVIVDRTNMSRKSRKMFLKDLPETYESVAVLFTVPDTVLKQRLEARAAATGKSIPADVLESMASRYMAPDREEFTRIVRVNQ
jgi:predicted kinase